MCHLDVEMSKSDSQKQCPLNISVHSLRPRPSLLPLLLPATPRVSAFEPPLPCLEIGAQPKDRCTV